MNITKSISGVFQIDVPRSRNGEFLAWDAQWPEKPRCAIHVLRNSFQYLNYKGLKKFSSDFKAVYDAPTEETAPAELEGVKETWGRKYPYAISNWENK